MPLFGCLFVLVVLALLFVDGKIPFTERHRLQQQCQDFGRAFLEDHSDLFDDDSSKITFFYSRRLDTCVQQNVDELGNDFYLCDAKRNYLKQEFDDPRVCGAIFHCDASGVNSLILEKAESFDGELFHVSYSDVLDDGEGGAPATLKTPERPYSRERCKNLFEKKLSEIR